MKEIIVPESDTGIRLDRFLKKIFPSLKQGEIEKWCRKGLIRSNGKSVKAAGLRIESGQIFQIPSHHVHAESPKESVAILTAAQRRYIGSLVIAEHEDFWVLDKPSGLAVQGGTNTYNHLDRLLIGLKDQDTQTPKIVHRLDKDTSGLILIAKNEQAARFLTLAFKEKRIQKVYYAIVVGCPKRECGLIDAPISKLPSPQGEKMSIDHEHGLSAQTYFQVERKLSSHLYLLRLEPVTGRTHQLRVHCAYMGTPILGDGKYGGKHAHPLPQRTRLMLHATRIELKDKNQITQVYYSDYQTHFKKDLDINL